MIKKAKRRLAAAVFAVMMTFGVAVAVAPSASAASGTISGTVDCFYGNDAEVGVWVNATTGNDGWATTWSNGTGGIYYSYNLSQASSYQLTIGCGGTPSSWGKAFPTWPDAVVNGQTYEWICTFVSGRGYVCYDT